MALCIIIALPVGCRVSLGKMKNNLEDEFRTGEDGHSIQSDLDIICSNSSSILSVAGRFCDSDDSLYSEAKKDYEAMLTASTVGEKSIALGALSNSIETLYREIKENTELSETDLRLIKQCEGEIQSRCMTIKSEGYNDDAAAFNRKRGTFPANIIAPLVGIDEAELF